MLQIMFRANLWMAIVSCGFWGICGLAGVSGWHCRDLAVVLHPCQKRFPNLVVFHSQMLQIEEIRDFTTSWISATPEQKFCDTEDISLSAGHVLCCWQTCRLQQDCIIYIYMYFQQFFQAVGYVFQQILDNCHFLSPQMLVDLRLPFFNCSVWFWFQEKQQCLGQDKSVGSCGIRCKKLWIPVTTLWTLGWFCRHTECAETRNRHFHAHLTRYS